METYCIAMQRETLQRQRVQQMFDDQDIPFRFFDAVDGRAGICKEYTNLLHPLARSFGHPSVVGCGLSHYLLWQHLHAIATARGDDKAQFMICESDVLIPDSFKSRLQDCLQETASDFDVLLVGNRNFTPNDYSWGRKVCNVLFCGNKTCIQLSATRYQPDIALALHCYIVSVKGLERLLKSVSSKLGWHIDHLLQNSHNLRIQAVYPPLASQCNVVHSSIADKTTFPVTLNYLLDQPVENGFSLSYWMNCPIGQIGGVPLNLWILLFLFVALVLCLCQVSTTSIILGFLTLACMDIGWSLSLNGTSNHAYQYKYLVLIFVLLLTPSILNRRKKIL